MRAAAVRALANLGDTRAVEPLIDMLHDGEDWVFRTAVKALPKTGDRRAVTPLVRALSRSDEWARRTAAEALGDVGDRRSVEPLVRALGDQDESVRRAAATALGRIGDPRAVKPLRDCALSDDSGWVRVAAAGALGAIGLPATDALVAVVKDRSGDVLERSIRALARVGAPAVEPLLALLVATKPSTRQTARRALAAIGSPAVRPLVHALGHESRAVRIGAIGVLEELAHKPVVGPLAAALSDAVEPLIYRLAAGSGDERMASATTLVQIRDLRAVQPLVAALGDDHWYERAEAARSLEKLSWEPDTGETGATYWAVRGDWDKCVEIGVPAVGPLLLSLSATPLVGRGAIAGALGEIGDRRAVEPLVATLAAVERRARDLSAETDDYDAREMLEVYTDDDSPGHSHYHSVGEERLQKRQKVERETEQVLAAASAAVSAPSAVTGQDFGADADRWREWWAKQQ